MFSVLTGAATLACNHGGTVQPRIRHNALTVAGSPVLIKADLLAGEIVGCPQSPPCKKPMSILAGVSVKLSVGAEPVLLATATGPTDAGGTWTVTFAGPTQLEAAQ
jgi:hypothetical protein